MLSRKKWQGRGEFPPRSEGIVVSVHHLEEAIDGFHVTGTATQVWDPVAAARIRESIIRIQMARVHRAQIAMVMEEADLHG
jgi:hypothetical protein